MDDAVELSVALEILNRKIAELNMKIIDGDNSDETQKILDKCLDLKEEISGGNMSSVKDIIDGKAGIWAILEKRSKK